VSLEKRSMTLEGHRTSIALEPAFWAALEAIAAQEGVAMTSLMARIDAARADKDPDQGLASAARVFALLYKERA
jgi:predicted DNA-binding ribbon-helix-helix protein